MSWIDNNINKDIADYLFNVRLECLPSQIGVYQRDVRPDLTINFEELEQQLMETPEMLCFWDMLLAEQKNRRARLERKREILRGYITTSILKDANDRDLKMRREDIKDVINADTNMIAMESEILKELKKEDHVKAIVRAIQAKAEHLRSLSGFKREEQRQVR